MQMFIFNCVRFLFRLINTSSAVYRKRLVTREKRLRAEQQKSEASCSLQKEVAKWLNAQKQRSTARAQRQQQNYRYTSYDHGVELTEYYYTEQYSALPLCNLGRR